MLNKLLPTYVVDNYGIKYDTKGRAIFMKPSIITRPGKYYGQLMWIQTPVQFVPSSIAQALLKH